MHAAITFIIACLPALHIDHDPATDFVGDNVQPKHSLLYLKRSMDGVQHGTQGEVDFARGAIEIERNLSGRRTGLRDSCPPKPRMNKSSAKQMFTGADASCRKRCRVRANAARE
jgi:hypothetical protein